MLDAQHLQLCAAEEAAARAKGLLQLRSGAKDVEEQARALLESARAGSS